MTRITPSRAKSRNDAVPDTRSTASKASSRRSKTGLERATTALPDAALARRKTRKPAGAFDTAALRSIEHCIERFPLAVRESNPKPPKELSASKGQRVDIEDGKAFAYLWKGAVWVKQELEQRVYWFALGAMPPVKPDRKACALSSAAQDALPNYVANLLSSRQAWPVARPVEPGAATARSSEGASWEAHLVGRHLYAHLAASDEWLFLGALPAL